DALLVLIEAVVALELDPARGQLVDRLVDVVHGKVQDRVGGWSEVRLHIDERRPVAGEVQRHEAVFLGHHRRLDPERLAVELPGLSEIIDGEAAVCPGVGEHGYSSPRQSTRSGMPKRSKKSTNRPATIGSSGQRRYASRSRDSVALQMNAVTSLIDRSRTVSTLSANGRWVPAASSQQ